MEFFSMPFQAHLQNAYHAAYPIQCRMLVTYPRFLLDPELCLYSIYPIGPIDMFMPVTQQAQFLVSLSKSVKSWLVTVHPFAWPISL